MPKIFQQLIAATYIPQIENQMVHVFEAFSRLSDHEYLWLAENSTMDEVGVLETGRFGYKRFVFILCEKISMHDFSFVS